MISEKRDSVNVRRSGRPNYEAGWISGLYRGGPTAVLIYAPQRLWLEPFAIRAIGAIAYGGPNVQPRSLPVGVCRHAFPVQRRRRQKRDRRRLPDQRATPLFSASGNLQTHCGEAASASSAGRRRSIVHSPQTGPSSAPERIASNGAERRRKTEKF